MGVDHKRESWRVRIRDANGAVLGAGVLLGNENVLTCAHVVLDVGDEVIVDFVGLRDASPVGARILPGCFVPPLTDRRGDVALLRLDRPQADGIGTMLRRTALSWDREVHTHGFPRGLEDGVWARTTLAAQAGPGQEWLQMNARSSGEQRVRSGFSGAGVTDDKTGDVLGIVVGEYTDEAASLSWMVPVETILHHVPLVAEWVTGDAAADDVFGKPVAATAGQVGVARMLADWLARRGTGEVVMIIVGADLAVLHRAVALSSREWRPAGADASDGTVPAVGSIDLAVDASGKTVDQVSRRIIDRAGIPVDESTSPSEQVRAGTPPMTVVVDGVDDAEHPEALLDEVLKPLAERGTRLVLGFRRDSSPSLTKVQSWELGFVSERLERLAERINALGVAEQELVSHGQPIDDRATRLRIRLSGLRKAAAGFDPELTRRKLEECERAVVRALRRTEEANRRLDEQLAERNELRGRLDAYKAKAADNGLAENVELADLYRRAYELLWRPPYDPWAAREAVRVYRLAVGGQRQ